MNHPSLLQRFKALIVAAVTAAAEFQRLQAGSRADFDLLEKLPDLLQEKVSPRRSRLLSLFQPQPETTMIDSSQRSLHGCMT